MNEPTGRLHDYMERLRAFLREIRRRRMIRAAITYLVSAWVLIEVASVVVDAFNVPDLVLQGLIALVVIGLPLALALAWVYDLTSRGIVRTAEAEPEPEEQEAPTRSQRRRMTMLRAVISVEARGEVDPEDLLELQPAAMRLARKVCRRFGGELLAGHGGEVLAYFGYPVAAEDDTHRAIRAALGLVEGIDRIEHSKGEQLNVSVLAHAAVHTGEVITEESDIDGDGQPEIFGVLPGVAAELLKEAQSDQVLITADTHRAVRGYFDVKSLGVRALGETGSREVFQVLHLSTARTRLETIPAEELTPLAGRDHELGILRQAWNRSTERSGQTVVVAGGAGIGKSRIMLALRELAAENTSAWLVELYCQSTQQNTTLHPVVDYLRRDALMLEGADGDDQKLDRIEGLLAEFNEELAETVPLLAGLLQVPLGDRYAPLGSSQPMQRKATLQLLVTLLTERSNRQPVLFVVEDLHWADPTTLELLALLIEEVPAHSLMVGISVRTPYEPPWPSQSQVSQLNLAGLNADAARAVCAQLGPNLPAPVVASIVEKADGVPLFIEEVTKTVVESGAFDQPVSEAEMQDRIGAVVPDTLQDALTARLDRLGKAREVAQLGATIGREFSGGLFLNLAERLHLRKAEDKLQRLVDAEILFRRGRDQGAQYRFKHALIQDAAYRQLVRKQRQHFHREIASVLEADFPEIAKEKPELLALHYTRADRGEAAIPLWLAAGRKAARASADLEAMSHLQHGLALLDQVGSAKERTQMELELQVAMGPPLMASHGYSSETVQACYARAQELCEQVGETPRLIPVLAGLWAYNEVRANLAKALEYAQRLNGIAKSTKNEDLLLESHVFLGVTCMHLARLEDSVNHMRSALEIYDPARHGDHAYIYGQDPGMAAHVYLADALWLQGHPAEALREAEAGIAHARKLKHPLSLAFALAVAARMAVRHTDIERAQTWGGEALQISERFGFPVWGTMARILSAWATSRLKGAHAAVSEMQEVLDDYRAKGTYVSTAYYLALLAELLGQQEQFDRALKLIDEALDKNYAEDRHAEPEILRIRGELLRRRGLPGDRDESAQSLLQALKVAEILGANGWSIKAAVSFSRLMANNEEKAEATRVLSEALAKFPPEESSPDLEAARALYERLRA